MRHSFCIALLLAALPVPAAVHAQDAPGRTVIGSVRVGEEGGRMLSCKDIVSPQIRPSLGWRGWTQDSQLTDRRPAGPRAVPRLPESANPEVSYGDIPSRNEFGIDRGWYPSPDGERLAVYRVDRSKVGSFPILDISSRSGSLNAVKYPMNGMESEVVSLCVCDTLGNILSTLNVSDFTEEHYLSGVTWTPDGSRLLVQVTDRSQHEVHLNLYDASDGSFLRTILEERNDAWVEPREGVYFLKGSDFFIYRTDNRDGFRQLYLCDLDGNLRRLTSCGADVEYIADDGQYVYYTSAEVSPVEQHLFRLKISNLTKGRRSNPLGKLRIGAPERLTQGSGVHSISMSPDCKHYIDRFSSLAEPGRMELHRCDGTLEELLSTASDPMAGYAPVSVELGSVPSADPQFVNYYRLVKPADFDPSRKYPLIIYVYGGPHSQMVRNTWLAGFRAWELLMAQKGYVLYIQDNRGTDNRGSAFEKAINRRCGEAETADQMRGLQALISEGWVDETRIGVVGWSYGGFMTITMATRHPDVFKVAAAGGPVIDWKWYEVMYGERYMDTPETNPEGFAATSLVDKAPLLKARLLVCQGMEDSTVLPINSLSFMQSCVEHNVLADYYPYPRSPHNVVGPWREQLYLKLTDYFDTWL